MTERYRYAVRLLGAPAVDSGVGWVRVTGRRRAVLLAYLALEGPCERARLAALLWASRRATDNLRVELHRLERRFPGLVLREGDRLALAAGSDVAGFLEALERGAFGEAVARYGGPLLEGAPPDLPPDMEEWLLLTRERLEERYLEALAAEADRVEADAPQRALELHRRVLERDPTREASCRGLMRLYARLGEVGKALERYERYARFLEREFGLPPAQETRRLAAELRTGRRHPGPRGRPAFVGRSGEMARALEAWQARRPVVVVGEPGIGKTRFLYELAAALDRSPRFLRGRPEDREVPLGTVVRGLRELLARRGVPRGWVRAELARLLPELGEPAREDSPHRFLAAMAELLMDEAEGPWLLGVDDLQYFDEASLDLLVRMAAIHVRVPFVVALRKGWRHPSAERWLQGLLERDGAELIELPPLSAEEVAAMLGEGGGSARAADLHAYTGGNPFFVVQVVGLRSEEGAPRGAEAPPGRSERLFALLRRRMAGAGAFPLKLLRLAAVAGEAYGPALAARLLGASALEVAEAADALEPAGLFRRGRLAHDLVREAVLRDLDAETVRALHRQLAEALAEEGPPGLVAHHFEQAGLPGRAVAFRLRAAELAAGAYAYGEALEQYERALEDAPEEERLALEARTFDARYVTSVGLGDWERADRLLQGVARVAEVSGDAWLAARVQVARADWCFRTWRMDEAVARATEVLAAPALDDDSAAHAHYVRAVALQVLGRQRESIADCHAALERRPDPDWMMHGWVHNTLGLNHKQLGELGAARRHNDHALAVFRARGDEVGEANALRTLAEILAAEGQPEQAATTFEQALRLARKTGHGVVRTFVLAAATRFFEASGEVRRARALAREGLELAGPYRDFFDGVLRRLGA